MEMGLVLDGARSARSERGAGGRRHLRVKLYALLMVADCAAIILGFALAARIRGDGWLSPGGINLALVAGPLYLLFAFSKQAYSLRALISAQASARSALYAFAMAVVTVALVGFALHASDMVSRLAFTCAVALSSALLVTQRVLIRAYVSRWLPTDLLRRLVILDGCAPPRAVGNCDVIQARSVGIEPDLANPQMLNRLGMYLVGYDRVIVYCGAERRSDWALVLKGANITGELATPALGDLGAIGVAWHGGQQTLVVARGPLNLVDRAKKRAFDLLFTIPALILLAPLMLAVAIAIRSTSPGPIFFRQQRVGRGNRIFEVLKFRSMRVEQCDSAGNVSTARGDDRITGVGRFIRKISIDELPQLLNVLLGDMSLVGPRPHALGSLAGDALFWEVDPTYWHRHALKPGITGLAQVRGFRGATHQRSDLQNRLRADLEYIEGWNIWRDLSILAGTVLVVVHKNAF